LRAKRLLKRLLRVCKACDFMNILPWHRNDSSSKPQTSTTTQPELQIRLWFCMSARNLNALKHSLSACEVPGHPLHIVIATSFTFLRTGPASGRPQKADTGAGPVRALKLCTILSPPGSVAPIPHQCAADLPPESIHPDMPFRCRFHHFAAFSVRVATPIVRSS
jgi:hypothetical protein